LHRAETDPTVAIALLHAARAAGAREEAQELLKALPHDEDTSQARRYFESWLSPAQKGGDEDTPGDLMMAVTTLARTETPRYRQQCYRALLNSKLLVAFDPPAPRLARDLTVEGESLEPVLTARMNSFGGLVAIAFTDADARAKWKGTATCVEVEAAELFERLVRQQKLELELNPAGPASLEFNRSEIAKLAAGTLPVLSDDDLAERRSYFLIEPFEQLPAARAVTTLREKVSMYVEVREAWLIQTVEEKRGTSLTVALLFSPDASAGDRREVLADLADPKHHPETARHVRFIEADEPDTLLQVVRDLGSRLL
jgi:hypothetical protein